MDNTAREPIIASPTTHVGTPGPLREQMLLSGTMRRIQTLAFREIVAPYQREFIHAGDYLRANG